MSKIIITFFLFLGLLANASNIFVIEGKFVGAASNMSVTIVEYNCGEVIIDHQQIISSGDYLFNLPKHSSEGIFTCRILHETDGKSDVSEFDFIIDFRESKIKFQCNIASNDFPDFFESEINKNWYSFLKLQKAKVAHYTSDDIEGVLLKDKLLQIQNNFINQNYNKWSTYFVKNEINMAHVIKLNERTFWNNFDTTNPDLISTPIFQNIIQYYIINFYKNATVSNYKIAFDNVIAAFSNNNETKQWIVKYIIKGQKDFDNQDLTTYFSTKYEGKL